MATLPEIANRKAPVENSPALPRRARVGAGWHNGARRLSAPARRRDREDLDPTALARGTDSRGRFIGAHALARALRHFWGQSHRRALAPLVRPTHYPVEREDAKPPSSAKPSSDPFAPAFAPSRLCA